MSHSSRPHRVPRLCHHKRSGRAYATFHSRQVQFGEWGESGTQDAYSAYVARWLANGRQPIDVAEPEDALTVADVVARFLVTLEVERDASWLTHNIARFRYACRSLVNLYGMEQAAEFGPKSLKVVRQAMIDSGRLCRRQINERVQTIRRVFAWAVAEELAPASIAHGLDAIAHLRRGHVGTHEGRDVRPVSEEVMRATLPFLSPTIGGIVELLWWTGARPGEMLALCPRDIDKSDPDCWSAPLKKHKTAARGRLREVLFGREAQAVLRRFLNRVPLLPEDLPIFSPKRAMKEWSVHRRAERRTPIWPSHIARKEREHAEQEAQSLGDIYTADVVRKAVLRGLQRANDLRAEEGLPAVPHWTPYMLRHAAATRIRSTHGLEAVRVVLGHASAEMSEHYAEADLAQARKIVRDM